MATGRVLQFDQSRGYGFVAAEDGGDDIFLHASVFDGDPEVLIPGTRVEFQVMAGDRGRKAFQAHLVEGEPDPQDWPVRPAQPTPVSPPRQVAAAAAEGVPIPAPLPATDLLTIPDDEQMCDVLPPVEFEHELTELFLSGVPELTGAQILQARQIVLEFAKKHGWSDG